MVLLPAWLSTRYFTTTGTFNLIYYPRLLKIKVYIMMLNSEEIYSGNIYSEKVCTLITGFWKPEEEKDTIKLREQSEDFLFHNISEIRPNRKLTLTTTACWNNGQNSPSITISLRLLLTPKKLLYQSNLQLTMLWTMVCGEVKPGKDISWTVVIVDGLALKKSK